MAPRWTGPWTIIRKINDLVYVLQAHKDWPNPEYEITVSLDNMKPFVERSVLDPVLYPTTSSEPPNPLPDPDPDGIAAVGDEEDNLPLDPALPDHPPEDHPQDIDNLTDSDSSSHHDSPPRSPSPDSRSSESSPAPVGSPEFQQEDHFLDDNPLDAQMSFQGEHGDIFDESIPYLDDQADQDFNPEQVADFDQREYDNLFPPAPDAFAPPPPELPPRNVVLPPPAEPFRRSTRTRRSRQRFSPD